MDRGRGHKGEGILVFAIDLIRLESSLPRTRTIHIYMFLALAPRREN